MRRRDQLEEESDEEDTERYDHARARSEAWANWLEEHPRGAEQGGEPQACCCLPKQRHRREGTKQNGAGSFHTLLASKACITSDFDGT